MKICIHRGTDCIGGCVTELRTKEARILIDFGEQLPGDVEKPLHMADLDTVDAVFFTHYHGDHIGLLEKLPPHIPVYLGATAAEIFRHYAARVRLAGADRLRPLRALEPVQVGDMTVLPIPADHSAYDAFMYLVTAEGKHVLHTGDFRLHGFRGKATWKLLAKYAPKVDLLICEGTKIQGTRGHSEWEVQQDLKQVIAQHKYVFILCSSTNIDRLASIYHAVPQGRYFLCDAYQKEILQSVETQAFSPWYRFPKALTPGENLKLRERGFVMAVRASRDFIKWMDRFPDSVLVYSMWPGYLDGRAPMIEAFVRPYAESGRMLRLHASGHAPGEDLLELCKRVSPELGVLPIHTQWPQAFPNGICLKDGETLTI